MEIIGVRVELPTNTPILLLRERDGNRYLPIWIGTPEAESITIALQEVEVARPLTHDLVKNIFHTLDARVIRIEVISLRDDTFYGNIVAEVDGRNLNIDSRPSDALALAVRAHVPILVARDVMDSAGIIPEEDMQGEGEELAEADLPEIGSERLSVFEDFLEHLEEQGLVDLIERLLPVFHACFPLHPLQRVLGQHPICCLDIEGRGGQQRRKLWRRQRQCQRP